MQHLINKVHNLDALDLLTLLEPQSVDAIITDLPYGTTACTWDTIIPFAPMWTAVKRVLKPRGVFVTTASQPFTSALVMSNPAWFRYEWVWNKLNRVTGFFNASLAPLKIHENILVFSPSTAQYFPIMTQGEPYNAIRSRRRETVYGVIKDVDGLNTGTRYPTSIIPIKADTKEIPLHPTQKPVALYEYLISTYTLPGDLVVDPTCGSGTTGVAARNLKRDYILNDSAAEYVEIARDRLRNVWDKPRYKESDLSGLPLFDGMIDEEDHS